MNNNIKKISKWAKDWFIKFNPAKTEVLNFSKKRLTTDPLLTMDDIEIQNVKKHTHLHVGLILEKDGRNI